MLFIHSSRLLPSGSLLLSAPSPQDTAQFECVASNEVGEAHRLYQVTVHGEWGGAMRKCPFPECFPFHYPVLPATPLLEAFSDPTLSTLASPNHSMVPGMWELPLGHL